MSYQTKLDTATDKTIQLGGRSTDGVANPTSVEGYYLGAKDTPAGAYGPGKLHIFKTEKGNVGVWGKTNSNRLLTADLVGQMVLMTFTGMSEPKKGKRPAYQYKVQHDPNNTIDTAGVDLDDAGAESDEDYVDADVLDEEEEIEEAPPARPVRPARAAAAPDAAKQARVQALLNGNRTKA